jgi:hypothetical protein
MEGNKIHGRAVGESIEIHHRPISSSKMAVGGNSGNMIGPGMWSSGANNRCKHNKGTFLKRDSRVSFITRTKLHTHRFRFIGEITFLDGPYFG